MRNTRHSKMSYFIQQDSSHRILYNLRAKSYKYLVATSCLAYYMSQQNMYICAPSLVLFLASCMVSNMPQDGMGIILLTHKSLCGPQVCCFQMIASGVQNPMESRFNPSTACFKKVFLSILGSHKNAFTAKPQVNRTIMAPNKHLKTDSQAKLYLLHTDSKWTDLFKGTILVLSDIMV